MYPICTHNRFALAASSSLRNSARLWPAGLSICRCIPAATQRWAVGTRSETSVSTATTFKPGVFSSCSSVIQVRPRYTDLFSAALRRSGSGSTTPTTSYSSLSRRSPSILPSACAW